MINITDITFKNSLYSASFQKKLTANVGDDIEIKIEFSTPTAFTYINFWHNFTNANANPYNFSGFELSNAALANLVTKSFTRIVCDLLGNFDVKQPKQSESYTSYTLTNVAANNYKLIIVGKLTPFLSNEMFSPQTGQMLNNTPNWAFSGDFSTLKYVFRIQLLDALQDEISGEDTNLVDISAFYKRGNIGAFNENFDGNPAKYTIINFDDLSDYNPADEYVVNCQIQLNPFLGAPAVFDNAFDLTLFTAIVPFNDLNYNASQNYLNNVFFEEVTTQTNGTFAAGAYYISNFYAVVNALDNTILDISFKINQITDPAKNLQNLRFIYWFRPYKTGNTYYNNTIPVAKVIQPAFGYFAGKIYGTRHPNLNPASSVDGINFVKNWNTQPIDYSNAYSESVAFVADDQTAFFRIVNTNNANIVINSFEFGIKNTATGTFLPFEYYTKTEAEIAAGFVVTDLGFQRDPTNQHNQITFVKVNAGSTDYYDIAYGFNFQNANYTLANTSFVVIVNYSQFILGAPSTNIVEFRSVPFRAGNYGATLNTAPDAIVLPDAANQIDLYPTDALGNIIGANYNKIVPALSDYWLAEFNWIDTRAIPDKVKLLADEFGHIYVFPKSQGNSPKTWLRINTKFDDTGNPVLLKTLGSAFNRAEKVDYPSAVPPIEGTKISARINLAAYRSYFGTSESPCFVARLDFIQTNANPLKEISFNFRYDLIEITYQLTEALQNAAFEDIFSFTTGLQFWYGLTVGTMIPYGSFALWAAAVNSAPAGSYIKIVNSNPDANVPLLISYKGLAPNTQPFTYNLDYSTIKVGKDYIMPFKYKVFLTGTYTDLYAGIRTNTTAIEDYGIFPYDLSTVPGVNALNAAIIGLSPEPVDYVIHFFNKTNSTFNLNFQYITADRNRLQHLEEQTNVFYRSLLAGNGSNFNGINQYNYINAGGFNQALIDNGATFTMLLAIKCTTASPYNTIFTTRTAGLQPKGFEVTQFTFAGDEKLIFQFFQAPGQQFSVITNEALSNTPATESGYNLVMFEFAGSTANIKCWINKKESTFTAGANTLPFGWSIQNGLNDAMIGALGTGTPAYFWGGSVKIVQFVVGSLSFEEREASFNNGSMEGIISDANFIFDADMSVQPPTNRALTPAFTAVNVGAVTTSTFII